jgi:hypothetical protein
VEWWQQTRIRYGVGEDDAELVLRQGGTPAKTFTKSEVVGLAQATQWTRKRLDVTTWAAGQAAFSIQFTFDNITSPGSTDEGWYVDNPRILVEKL